MGLRGEKLSDSIINRRIHKKTSIERTRVSQVKKEVDGEGKLTTCIGFCNPPTKFMSVSRYNKVCPKCKLSDRWSNYV